MLILYNTYNGPPIFHPEKKVPQNESTLTSTVDTHQTPNVSSIKIILILVFQRRVQRKELDSSNTRAVSIARISLISYDHPDTFMSLFPRKTVRFLCDFSCTRKIRNATLPFRFTLPHYGTGNSTLHT